MARKLRWTDVQDIAIELEERHPDVDNVNLRFTDLHRWVMELPDFEDDAGAFEREDPRGHPGRLDRRARLASALARRRNLAGNTVDKR